MLKFNNDHVFTGYLKQLLASFNLPKYKVYTGDTKKYFDENGDLQTINTVIPNVSYIKDEMLARYTTTNGWKTIPNSIYFYDKKIINGSKTLKISDNIYDSYTHEYLGDYLRFQRDYNHIDLMPLYNCFSNRLCTKLTKAKTDTVGFETDDQRYKIYMIPVKLFQEYTIAIDCATPVEMYCGIYGQYQDESAIATELKSGTYKRYSSLSFCNPVVYKKLMSFTSVNISAIAHLEQNLKLFIKLPKNNNSSITILEGNYSGYNNIFYTKVNTDVGLKWTRRQNKFVTNYENINNHPDLFKPITLLQLLAINTNVSYPFAGRLLEYLIGNAITSNDEEEPDNIKRIQQIMYENNNEYTVLGAWEDKINHILYDYINSDKYANTNDYNHDILGYADKDVEKWYKSWHIVSQKEEQEQKYGPKYKAGDKVTINTLTSVDIYPEQTNTINGGE